MRKITHIILYLTTGIFGLSGLASAQDLGFRPSIFSGLENPLSIEVGDLTLQLRGYLDQSTHQNLRTDDVKLRTTGSLTLSAETQLRSGWTVGGSYKGQYTTRPGSITNIDPGSGDKYTDEIKTFAGGTWGKIHAGHLDDLVKSNTRRKLHTGNAALAFETALSGLDGWTAGYSGRFGPAELSAVVDEKLNGEIGIRGSRPIGNKDIGLGFRGTKGVFTAQDGSLRYKTYGLEGIADVIYGSTLMSAIVGYERLTAGDSELDRMYASLGIQHKIASLTVSASGHYGQLDGNDEISAAIGAKYDFARGFSVNLGLNYAKLLARNGTVMLVSKDAVEAAISIRYDF